MTRLLLTLLCLTATATGAEGQHPLRHHMDAMALRFAREQPVLHYTLRVANGDTTGFDVELRIRNARDTIRLGMVAHPEYDDRFWRFVESVRAETPAGPATVVREDSALWRVITAGGEVVVRYRVRVPFEPRIRASWRPFMSPTGALVGGPHAFMYVVGASLAPMHVVLDLPRGWDVATGLERTDDPRTFFAPSADMLVDAPILVGALRSWRFAIDGVPHRVAYWPLPNAAPFDTVAFVSGIERLARQAVALFGRAPYREYVFLYQDDAYGGLEHANSVTLGAPSEALRANVSSHLEETAHEFVHTWNLMRIRPSGRKGVRYRPGGRSRELWFSEGLTIFYADLLLRRAGLPTEDSTRVAHLESIIARYYNNPGNRAVSPERASYAEYGGTPGELGDYEPSVHLQGEVIGAMLDLRIRDATGNRRSMDDVMRLMLERYSGVRPFTGRDVERTIAEVCGCAMRSFFDAHIRGATPVDLDRGLALAGLRMRIAWVPALGRDSTPAVDVRIRGWVPEGGSAFHLVVNNPRSVWGRAGLHTGDRLDALNGAPVADWPALRAALSAMRIGDSVRVAITRAGVARAVSFVMTGYDYPQVRVEPVAAPTRRQRALFTRWSAGAP